MHTTHKCGGKPCGAGTRHINRQTLQAAPLLPPKRRSNGSAAEDDAYFSMTPAEYRGFVLRMSEADRRLLYSSGSEHWKECRDELYGVLGAAGYAALEAEANPKKQSRGGSGIWAAEKY